MNKITISLNKICQPNHYKLSEIMNNVEKRIAEEQLKKQSSKGA